MFNYKYEVDFTFKDDLDVHFEVGPTKLAPSPLNLTVPVSPNLNLKFNIKIKIYYLVKNRMKDFVCIFYVI